MLTDGIGSIDVSNTSADHAVTIDPLTAERIEVLHGPAVLLYGGQAIGGAVNVIDRRIPHVIPEDGYHLDAIGTLATAAGERSIGAAADVALGKSGFVAHRRRQLEQVRRPSHRRLHPLARASRRAVRDRRGGA